jgi:hypothetical protein
MSTAGRHRKKMKRRLAFLWKFGAYFNVSGDESIRVMEMRNKYGGVCYQCQKWVPPGEGHFERYRGGWRVQHVACCLVHRDGLNRNTAERIQKKIPKNLTRK